MTLDAVNGLFLLYSHKQCPHTLCIPGPHYRSSHIQTHGTIVAAVVIAHRQNQIIFMYFCVDFNEMTGFLLFFISLLDAIVIPMRLLFRIHIAWIIIIIISIDCNCQCLLDEELRMRTQIDRFLLNYFAYNLVLIYLYHRAFFLTGHFSTGRVRAMRNGEKEGLLYSIKHYAFNASRFISYIHIYVASGRVSVTGILFWLLSYA